MLIYRATIRPRSAGLSPWQADTLFGHFCWLIFYEEGETALNNFLMPYKQGDPPILLSNGFPGDYLPRPILPAVSLAQDQTKAQQIAAMKSAKRAKEIHWVSVEDFNALRRGAAPELAQQISLKGPQVVLKNQINRLTGGTTAMEEHEASGNLYTLEELRFVNRADNPNATMDVSIYIKVRSEAHAHRVDELFQYLEKSGYGKKKSAGYGQIEYRGLEAFDEFEPPPHTANGFVSLSNWVPEQDDPTDGYYSTLVKYGKLGETLVHTENPFKFPITMFTAGSSFRLGEKPIKEWYGRLVPGIAPGKQEVVQYAYAFSLPLQLHLDTSQ